MKKIRHGRSVGGAILVFTIILLSVNVYQYVQFKNQLLHQLVEKINDAELKELKSYFISIEDNLKLIQAWGENDAFQENSDDLNRKLLPLLDHIKGVEAIAIASDNGREYFILLQEDHYLVRKWRKTGTGGTFRYSSYSRDHSVIKRWQEETDYDPRTRPWYGTDAGGERVYWTPAYTFHHTQKPGITASISWKSQQVDGGEVVLAMDLSIAGIKTVFSAVNNAENGILFLVNNEGKYLFSPVLGSDLAEGAVEQIIVEATEVWQKSGRPLNTVIEAKYDGAIWRTSFQHVDLARGLAWLGVLVPENSMDDLLKKSLFRLSFMEIFLSVLGFFGALMLLRRMDLTPGDDLGSVEYLKKYLDEGESSSVEFKSTIRANLRSGKHGKEIELAWLKSVCAFLNSGGGTLILGVTDDGTVNGLEADDFDSDDKCLLHVKNLLNQHIGAEYSDAIEVLLHHHHGKQLVMITVSGVRDAVFLKIGKNEEFYVRSGPSSSKLTPSQMVSFLKQKE